MSNGRLKQPAVLYGNKPGSLNLNDYEAGPFEPLHARVGYGSRAGDQCKERDVRLTLVS